MALCNLLDRFYPSRIKIKKSGESAELYVDTIRKLTTKYEKELIEIRYKSILECIRIAAVNQKAALKVPGTFCKIVPHKEHIKRLREQGFIVTDISLDRKDLRIHIAW